ncbi:MAG: 4-hydroxy-tetrahydrodipicolinate reductase [Bacteroidetes bacterium]|jgi:4-hydroxy-tetrahydrodipicolinate reductase|nr:4-hydroxy-tetrahydrodipicolinate reductase [Bacteroidota bacterium]
MKIALLGYGKMGKEIEKIALHRGHEIVLKVDENTQEYAITLADVAIEFSIPDKAVDNIKNCILNQVPVVSGTTGWIQHFDEVKKYCIEQNGAFIYASNYSLGVNLFFELNTQLAKLMHPFKDYQVSLEEIHHTQKLDAPSGTAISLAEQIIKNSEKTQWSLNPSSENDLLITAKREEHVPGTHSVFYKSAVDEIEIKHTAFNRQGFALGAVIAAEWLVDKKGVFGMKDVLGIK